jgi:hypothetical protein
MKLIESGEHERIDYSIEQSSRGIYIWKAKAWGDILKINYSASANEAKADCLKWIDENYIWL